MNGTHWLHAPGLCPMAKWEHLVGADCTVCSIEKAEPKLCACGHPATDHGPHIPVWSPLAGPLVALPFTLSGPCKPGCPCWGFAAPLGSEPPRVARDWTRRPKDPLHSPFHFCSTPGAPMVDGASAACPHCKDGATKPVALAEIERLRAEVKNLEAEKKRLCDERDLIAKAVGPFAFRTTLESAVRQVVELKDQYGRDAQILLAESQAAKAEVSRLLNFPSSPAAANELAAIRLFLALKEGESVIARLRTQKENVVLANEYVKKHLREGSWSSAIETARVFLQNFVDSFRKA